MLTIEPIQNNIVRLRLNRPDKKNALNLELIQALIEALQTHPARVCLLQGSGGFFLRGWIFKKHSIYS